MCPGLPLPILVFLGLSILDLGPMYVTDRQTDRQTDRHQTSDVRQHHRLMPPPIRYGGVINCIPKVIMTPAYTLFSPKLQI